MRVKDSHRRLLEQFIMEIAAEPRVPNQLIDPSDVAQSSSEDEEEVDEASAGGVVGAVGGGMAPLIPASASLSQKRNGTKKL